MPCIRRVSLIAVLLATACTQDPAQIALKGQNSYGKSAYNDSYYGQLFYKSAPAEPTEAMNIPTQQAAPAAPIASNDLTAPAKSQPKPVVLASTSSDQAINPWTNRPHFDSLAPASGGQNQQAAVSQLDRIISNDAPQAAAPKPVVHAQAGTFIWPVNGKKIISGFGPKNDGKVNDGINIAAEEGEPVWAAADGEVVYAGNELQGYGNMVLIKHASDKTTTYAHLNSISVDKYDRVHQGDIIGYVGTSGNVKEPQLHFAVRDGEKPVDPTKYLVRNVASN